jgi:general stress protein 26
MTDTTSDSTVNDNEQRVVELIKGSHVAMLTHLNADGRLVSHPMATQDVDYDGVVRFIAERDSSKVADLTATPQVNVSYSNQGSWVSLSGTATIENDEAKLRELWDTFTDAWLQGGPDNPNNILIEVTPDSAEFWDAPGGSKVVQVANLVKSRLTGKRVEGDNEVVDL